MISRIDLSSVSLDDRTKVYRNILERFRHSLRVYFPPESGYDHAWEGIPSTWRISRGRLWGLCVDLRLSRCEDRLDVSITPYFPLVRRYSSRVERWERDYLHLPASSRFFADHFVGPLLLVFVMPILPLMVLYRLALLSLMSSVRAAHGQLAATWPGIQASHAGLTDLPRPGSPATPYMLSAMVALAITVACFRFPPTDEALKIFVYVVGGIGVVVSLVLVTALALILLGFEVTR